jgi:capsular polysaccharide transport system ATP-binding protein
MIALRNVTKVYRTKQGPNVVLDRVTFQFPQNLNVGIIGKNGAGKSTLLRILGGVELPDAGKVVRKGRISWPLGFGGGFNGSLSGEENCRFVARIYGEDVDRVVAHARRFAELDNYFEMPVRTYSSGMRARLAFGLSMAVDFDTFLVDEVTAVGDADFKRKCQKAFDRRRRKASLIIVSHQMRTIREYCDKCAVLRDGRLHLFDSLDEAETEYEGLMSA